MNPNTDPLEQGIKVGIGLGSLVALRAAFKGSRQAGKGIYRRAVKLRGKNGR